MACHFAYDPLFDWEDSKLVFNTLMLTVPKSSLTTLMKSCRQNAKLGKYLKEKCYSEHFH